MLTPQPPVKAPPVGPAAKTNARGFVKSPINDMLTAIHGTTTVNVHPSKGISITHVPGLATLPAAKGAKVPVKPLPTTPNATVPAVPLSNTTGGGAPPKTPAPKTPKPKVKVKTPVNVAVAASPDPTVTDTSTANPAIQAILAPVIKQITDAETERAAAGQQAIGGYTSNAENQLKGIDAQAPFTQAASGANAINTALLARLTGAGSDQQNEVQGKIGAIDPALAAKIGAATAATANGAANAGLANGGATTSELLSEGANAGAYGKKQPGITALAGAQDTGKLQGQVASDQKTQLDSLTAKVPGMVQSELSTLSTARTAAEKNKIAQIIAEGYDPATGQLTPKARASLASATGYDPTTGKPTARTAVAEKNAGTAATRAANASKPKASASLSKQAGVLTDTFGNPILRNGKPVPVSSKGAALTPGETASLQAKAEKDAEDLYWGVTKTSATGTKTVVSNSVLYPEAVKTIANRYPYLGMKGAIKLANSLYSADGKFPDGTPNGRPLPKNSAKTNAAAAAGLGVPKTAAPFAGLGG